MRSMVVLLASLVCLILITQDHGVVAFSITAQAPRQASCTVTNTLTNPGTSNQYTLEALTLGGISTNMWNTASSAGEVQQCVDATGLHTTISLNEIQYEMQGAPAGSPEIGYGIDSYDVAFGPLSTKTTLSSFPMPVNSFDNLNYWISAGYSLGTPTPTDLTIDLTYDLWIEAAPSPGVGPKSGDLEIMLFLYNSNAPPDGNPICSSCFSEINPSGQSTVWSIYEGIGGAGTTTITFLLTSPTPTSTGSIAVQLQHFIEKALSYHPMSASAVLMGVELGTEFGGTYPAQPSASWSWTLSSLVLQNSCDTLELLPSGSESVCSPVTFHTNPSAEGSIQWGSCSGTSYTDEQTLSVPTGTYAACYVPSGYTFDSWSCSGGLSCAESTDPTMVTVTGSGSITLNLKMGSLSQPISTSLTASATLGSVTGGASLTVSGALTANGAGVGSETIVLVFSWNTEIATVTTSTDGSGFYSYTVTVPFSTGAYRVDAFFLGDYTRNPSTQYLPSKATAMITLT